MIRYKNAFGLHQVIIVKQKSLCFKLVFVMSVQKGHSLSLHSISQLSVEKGG